MKVKARIKTSPCPFCGGVGYSRMKAWLRGQNAMPQEWIDKGLKYIE